MFVVTALYKFASVSAERLPLISEEIHRFCTQREIKGLFLLSTEGCNATMSGLPRSIEEFKEFLQAIPEFGKINFKDSDSDYQPFRRLKIDIREEIVTLKRPDIVPFSSNNNHLSPTEWNSVLRSEEEYILIDTRNDYETEIGVFKGAVDPKIRNFSEFPRFIEEKQIPKDKKVLMYCTGGIRCEKALVFMQREGYQNVFQLDGGILNYLKEYPNGEFNGECFVFDHRVAVDSDLKPTTQYKLCPHCGNPGKESIHCSKCGSEAVVCHHCLTDPTLRTCSKNCAHHVSVHGARG